MSGSDEEGDYTLDIDSVTLEDDAKFQCQVFTSLEIVSQGTIAMSLRKWTPTTKLRWGQPLEGWSQSVRAILSSQSLVGWPWCQNHDDHVAASPNAALGFNVSDVEWWWPSQMYSVTYNMRPSCIEIYASPSKNIKNTSYKHLNISIYISTQMGYKWNMPPLLCLLWQWCFHCTYTVKASCDK